MKEIKEIEEKRKVGRTHFLGLFSRLDSECEDSGTSTWFAIKTGGFQPFRLEHRFQASGRASIG